MTMGYATPRSAGVLLGWAGFEAMHIHAAQSPAP